jgi:hypothetical protein
VTKVQAHKEYVDGEGDVDAVGMGVLMMLGVTEKDGVGEPKGAALALVDREELRLHQASDPPFTYDDQRWFMWSYVAPGAQQDARHVTITMQGVFDILKLSVYLEG